MREWLVVWAGRHQRDVWESLCAEYRKRSGRWVDLRDLPVRAPSAGDDPRRLAVEGERMLAAVPTPFWGIALDSGGRSYSSEAFAAHVGQLRHEWSHSVVFFLGSDLGLSPQVASACRERLSLGPLTFPHELARLVLYEQLYRALSIEAGINYHRPRF